MYWWVPLVLAAASAGANYAGQKKTDRARAAALREAQRLRSEKSDDAETAAKKTADLFGETVDKEADAAAEAEQRMMAAVDAGQERANLSDVVSGVQASSRPEVIEERARVADKSRAKFANRAKTLAGLNAFGDVMVGNEIGSAANRADIGQAGQSMQNWMQGVLPLQLEAANLKGRTLHTLADVLQAASMITGMGAMSAPAAGASTTTTVAPATTGSFYSSVPAAVGTADAAAQAAQWRNLLSAYGAAA